MSESYKARTERYQREEKQFVIIFWSVLVALMLYGAHLHAVERAHCAATGEVAHTLRSTGKTICVTPAEAADMGWSE